MRMVKAGVHLILLKVTHLLWLVSFFFAYLIIMYKYLVFTIIFQFNIEMVDWGLYF